MAQMSTTFGGLFKKYRLKTGFSTLAKFAETAASEGLVYEDSLFSHWQNNDRVPRDRHILLRLIKIFIKKGGIATIKEANELLASAGHGYLTDEEILQMNNFFSSQKLFTAPEKNTFLLEEITNFPNILDYITEQTALAYEKIYEGYPHMVYQNLGRLIKLIDKLKLDTKKGGKHVLSYVHWVRMRCLSDIIKPKNFLPAYKQTLSSLYFAKEKNTSEIGPNYWMVTAIRRLEIITRSKKIPLYQKEVEECWDIGQLALHNTSPTRHSERLVEHLELAKIAVILKDKNRFDRQMDTVFSCVSRLPAQKKHLEALAWDVLARGNLGLDQNTALALTHIRRAKNVSEQRYQAIGLFLNNTELQAFISIKDPFYSHLAEKLREEIKLKSSLLNNPYQKLRLRQEKDQAG